MTDLLDDLYAYNDWANAQVIGLCDGLTDEQLDATREMGFGTLRATLFHILTAEIIWTERWLLTPWRPFPTDPDGISVAEIAKQLADVAERRRQFIRDHRLDRFDQRIAFQDSKKNSYELALFDMLLHVANHGVHHRAQALNYLKQFDRSVVAGIDYIFYRLAEFPVQQSAEAIEGLTAYGLKIGDTVSKACPWDARVAARFYQYHDWAIDQVLSFVQSADDEALDRNFDMGPGSIRKTLLHLYDAESWWFESWTVGPNPFPASSPDTTIAELRGKWMELAEKRNEFIASVDDQRSQDQVEILAGGPPTRFRVGESIIHLAIHGTHHRAQLINMCRHTGAAWKDIDLLDAVLEF